MLANDALVLFDAQQHMSGLAPVGQGLVAFLAVRRGSEVVRRSVMHRIFHVILRAGASGLSAPSRHGGYHKTFIHGHNYPFILTHKIGQLGDLISGATIFNSLELGIMLSVINSPTISSRSIANKPFRAAQIVNLPNRFQLRVEIFGAITQQDFQKMWKNCVIPGMVFSKQNPLWRPISERLPDAHIELVGPSGRIIQTISLPNSPIAKISSVPTQQGELILITREDDICAGSGTGKVTSIYKIFRMKLLPQSAEESVTRNEIKISLLKTEKASWRLIRQHDLVTIFQIMCRPEHYKLGDFHLSFTKYTLKGGKWFSTTIMRKGYWETGDKFPPLDAFSR